jgi:hypothetical protein
MLDTGQLQVLLRIPVTDVLDESSQEFLVIGEITANHILPNQVAKDAPEIFVTWIGHKRARVGHHANEPRQQARVG